MQSVFVVLVISCLAIAARAAEVPGWVKESLRAGSSVQAAQDVVGTIAPRDLATAGLVWIETDPDFGPGTPGRSRLLLTLAAAPAARGEAHADDSVIRVLVRYWDEDGPSVRAMLHALERSSEAMRPAAREKAREYWKDGNWATASTALTATARVGGVSTEDDLAMMKQMVEHPETANPAAWESGGVGFRQSIPFSAAFVVLSSPLDLRESVEWAAGLEGEAREAARGALLGQMLIEDGAFAHAAPDLRIRWLEVFDTMLREIDDTEVRDFAMPLLMVMSRHPECTEQACRTLAYLRERAHDPRLQDYLAQVIRDAEMDELLKP